MDQKDQDNTPFSTETSGTNSLPQEGFQIVDTKDPATILPPADSVLLPSPPLYPKSGLSKRSKALAIFGIVFLLFVSTAFAALYALAYHKVELAKYPELQKRIEFFVMELPFTPKSARYLVYKMATIEKNYGSQSFDMSAAVNTNSTNPDLLGLSTFDIAAKGDLDFGNKENLLLNMNLSITKDFNMDLKAKDKQVYFKVNKVPEALLALTGLNSSILSPLMNVWVSYDTTPLQTEARDLLKEKDLSEETTFDENISKQIETYLDKSILSQMVVTKGDDKGAPVYKMHLNLTPSMIDDLEKKITEKTNKTSDLYIDPYLTPMKLSDGLTDASLDIWLEEKTYYTRHVAASFKITPDSSLSESLKNSNVLGITDSFVPNLDSTVSVAMVFNFADFGKTVVVNIPTDALTFEEFSKRASEILLQIYTRSEETPLSF